MPTAAARPVTGEPQQRGVSLPQRQGAEQRLQKGLPAPPPECTPADRRSPRVVMKRQYASDKGKLTCSLQTVMSHRSGGCPGFSLTVCTLVPVHLHRRHTDPAARSSTALIKIPQSQGHRMRATHAAACSAARPPPWSPGRRPPDSVYRPTGHPRTEEGPGLTDRSQHLTLRPPALQRVLPILLPPRPSPGHHACASAPGPWPGAQPSVCRTSGAPRATLQGEFPHSSKNSSSSETVK